MFASKHLNKEISALKAKIKDGQAVEADVVQALLLLIKVVRDVRTNQVSIMKFTGVPLKEKDVETSEEVEKE